MKKIISLGIASAVLAMTALSASAAVVIRTTDQVKEGSTITVDFIIDRELPAFGGVEFIVKTVGLKFVEGSEDTHGYLGAYNPADGKYGIIVSGALSANTTVLSLKFEVTAKEGEQISVNAENVAGDLGDTLVSPITPTVKGDDTSTSDPSTSDPSTSDPSTSDPSTSDPSTSDPSTSDPSTSDPSTSDPSTSDPASKPDGDNDNPNSGLALAVFPAIVAGAAVVVAKKRK